MYNLCCQYNIELEKLGFTVVAMWWSAGAQQVVHLEANNGVFFNKQKCTVVYQDDNECFYYALEGNFPTVFWSESVLHHIWAASPNTLLTPVRVILHPNLCISKPLTLNLNNKLGALKFWSVKLDSHMHDYQKIMGLQRGIQCSPPLIAEYNYILYVHNMIFYQDQNVKMQVSMSRQRLREPLVFVKREIQVVH